MVGNHISHLDPVFDAVIVRKFGRVPRFMAKASLWKVPVLGRVLAGSLQIPVDRTGAGAGQKSLELATEALRDGRVVLIYPEGTVTRDPDRWPMRPRPGVAALALSGDFPVIPIAHWGTQHIYDSYASGRKFHWPPRKDVTIVVGDPIDLTELRCRPVDARAIRDASLLIMGVIRDQLAEIRGETPPAEFYDPKKAERLARRAESDQAGPEHAGSNLAGPDQADSDQAGSGRGRTGAGRCRDEQLTAPAPTINAVGVLGAGSWGTTFAKVLADAGRDVTLWARRGSVADAIRATHVEPGLPARTSGCPRASPPPPISTRRWMASTRWCSAVPSQALRENLRVFRDSLPPTVPVVSLAKGVEIGTGPADERGDRAGGAGRS